MTEVEERFWEGEISDDDLIFKVDDSVDRQMEEIALWETSVMARQIEQCRERFNL